MSTGNNPIIGLVATVKGKDDVQFYSRFFAPWIGVNEDPVNWEQRIVSRFFFSNYVSIRFVDLPTVLSHRIGLTI